jgi:hypothetical protein
MGNAGGRYKYNAVTAEQKKKKKETKTRRVDPAVRARFRRLEDTGTGCNGVHPRPILKCVIK